MCARCSSPGRRIEYRHRVAGPVDEQLLAGNMRLPHRRRDALPPVAVALAEPAVGVALGVLGAILLPEQSQRHAAPLQLRMDVRPVRLDARRADAVSAGGNNRRSSSASSISSGIGQLRPATAARRTYSPTAVLPIPVASPTKPPAHPQRVRQTQHVTYLPHRHSLRRHRSPPGCQGDRSADSTVDGSALYAAITCCPQSPDCCPPCAGMTVRVAPDSASQIGQRLFLGRHRVTCRYVGCPGHPTQLGQSHHGRRLEQAPRRGTAHEICWRLFWPPPYKRTVRRAVGAGVAGVVSIEQIIAARTRDRHD